MCQSDLCVTPTEPENWYFKGLDWLDEKKNVKQGIVRHVCNTCAYRLMTVMAPALKAGQVEIRSMLQNKFTILCRNCFSEYRLDQINDVSRMNETYCPSCGKRALKQRDPHLDLWEMIAEELHLNVEVTKALYDGWLNDAQFNTFKEYVEAMEQEVANMV